MIIELVPLELKYCEAVAEVAKMCLPEAWSLRSIQDTLRYKDNIYYVAKDVSTGEIVAFAGIMVIVDEAELLNIAVMDSYRKNGIAQRLLDVLIESAREREAFRLLLEVRQSNDLARRLYSKNGFVAIGERKNYYSNPTEHAIIMEKIL